MRLMIIAGGMRYPSGSGRAAAFIRQKAGEQIFFDPIDLLDLGQNPLPLWDEGVWQGEEKWRQILTPLRERMQAADAYVLVSPEYNGMASPALKNLSLFFDERTTGHKPALIVAVTSEAHNGQYPVADLRAFGAKNTKWVYIPDHLIYRNIRQLITEDLQMTDALLEEQTLFGLRELRLYAEAMKDVRNRHSFRPEFKYAP